MAQLMCGLFDTRCCWYGNCRRLWCGW